MTLMHRSQLPTAQIATAAIAVVMSPTVAFAGGSHSDTSQNALRAPQKVETTQIGLSYTGIPMQRIRLSQQVSFADLDIATPAGQAKFEDQITAMASKSCRQLNKLYPWKLWRTSNARCVANAVNDAMKQEERIVAANERK
jgi:UrcA family protein